ncbi:DUF1702 family protein [Amycolatopsis sp. VS8301801F10]|uniref:DUF1702 family protein n=1 Tax=Amycolatopsis sp. VS8301801F10 TaxID=2652442 RepID=UPI0038FBE9FC
MPLRERPGPVRPGRSPGAAFRAARRKLLTPDVAETRLAVRGFHEKDAAARDLLETVGRTFLEGYGSAVESRSAPETVERLAEIPDRFRGFAYEGAGMGLAILDGLPLGGSSRVARLLGTEPGSAQLYLIYVGIGWAMARLPRICWPRPDRLDPVVRWLVLDGYGFHQAYFHTRKYVHEQYREKTFGWPDKTRGEYALRVVDQGIGRAMWFVGGADPDQVATLIERFPRARQADLYSGAGLAATYAGGVTREELERFRDRAGEHAPALAQGSVFAADARVSGGIVVPHNALATSVLCGMSPEEASLAARKARPSGPDDGPLPAYEHWRQALSRQFVSDGGAST